MTIDMSQFYEVFFEESAELLGEMERLLLELDVNAPSKDDLNAIFRTAHSIKGGAGTFGFTEITETTHILESLLDKLRTDKLKLRSEMVDVFLKACDVLKMQLAGRQYQSEVDAQAVTDICKRLNELAEAKQDAAPAPVAKPAPAVPAAPAAAAPAAAAPAAGGAETVDPTPENLYAILTGTAAAPAPAANEGYGFFTDAPAAAQAAPAAAQAAPAATKHIADLPTEAQPKRRASDRSETETTSIRVGVEKVDQLINLVGELVITQAMLAQAASRVDQVQFESLIAGVGQLERNSRDLQESVMSIRMMPISFVFSRFPRVVRDLAGKLNKQVELKTVGEGTELDKGLIEKIADPLNHLVRNSLDHAIEAPEVRIAAGKDPVGTITLRAFHQGGNIMVEVADDGAGLSREKILGKARERGMNVNDAMSDQEVWSLIFEPGFSTAAVVTDVSGRGVGMDVVRRNVRNMGGRVEIQSEFGKGTCISIRLPLTLAILDGMSVAVGKEIFIVPLTYIIESMQPAKDDIKAISGQGKVVHVRGEYLPVVALHERFNIKSNVGDTEMERGILVILEAEGIKSALFVDELVGQHQVVIKSLETNYRKAQGISGATIMGDGKVALILDVAALVRPSQHDVLRAA
ncbi:MAG: chemotaxis protein CheW [Proteobacteria bacterium]|nr:chemotaxis protein CheW [Pseudomonadota bacterium]